MSSISEEGCLRQVPLSSMLQAQSARYHYEGILQSRLNRGEGRLLQCRLKEYAGFVRKGLKEGLYCQYEGILPRRLTSGEGRLLQ
jgi:hypothetical protein